MFYTDDILYDYARSFIGVPYKWGGSNPMEGFDCSGLVVELLQSAGVLAEHSDYTSQSLYNLLLNKRVPVAKFGGVAFFGSHARAITHVGFCMSPHLMLEAGGGNSSTTDKSEASAKDAFVRVRPVLKSRKDLIGICMPNYFWREEWQANTELKN